MLAEEEAFLMEDDELDEWLELVKQQKALDRDTQDITPTQKRGRSRIFNWSRIGYAASLPPS